MLNRNVWLDDHFNISKVYDCTFRQIDRSRWKRTQTDYQFSVLQLPQANTHHNVGDHSLIWNNYHLIQFPSSLPLLFGEILVNKRRSALRSTHRCIESTVFCQEPLLHASNPMWIFNAVPCWIYLSNIIGIALTPKNRLSIS